MSKNLFDDIVIADDEVIMHAFLYELLPPDTRSPCETCFDIDNTSISVARLAVLMWLFGFSQMCNLSVSGCGV